MDYLKGAAATVVTFLVALLILLDKLWSGRRTPHNSDSVDNASRLSDTVPSASDSADSNPLPQPIGGYRRSSHYSNSVDDASRQLDSVASASDSADSNLFPQPIGEYRRSSHNSNSLYDASRQSDSVASASNSVDSNPLPQPIGEYRRSSHNLNSVDNATRQLDSVASASDSADSNPLPLPIGEYEVFLSFRGPDTRYQIIDVLYRFLINLKIRTFKDDDKIEKGEWIWPSLVNAIKQSKIYIPVFSENYAASKWCLRELAAIVEHRKENPGCIIIPIFYMMDPTDVRHQTGPYEKAFQQHKEDFDWKTIQSWKDALYYVGAIKGWHVKSNNEQGTLADLVIGVVRAHLSKSNNVLETDKLIGIDDHIEAVKGKLALDSPCMTIVGIHGIGGIGKTTIAEAVYNKISPQFHRCSFVEDVREMLQERNGVISLQKYIISDILKENESITSRRQGVRIIEDRIFSRFKFLIVLDDVGENFEFDKILGNVEKYISGSRFIITSRNVKVLSTLTDDYKLYRVREMNHQHSLQLFCKHAFKMDSPKSGFESLSKDIASVAAGLPLTLKVVGSLLYKEEEEAIWEDKLRRLKEIPEEEVMERLKISYKTLNKETKQIFLDIACFFIGEDKELPSYMWSDCDFFPVTHINILKQRSLIEIGSDYPYKKEKAFPMHFPLRDADGSLDCSYNLKKVFLMHDQLRDMGREIVRRKCIGNPLKRSRIWSTEKALEMLLHRKGTDRVKGIRVYYNCFEEEIGKISQESFMNLSEMRYMEMEVRMPIDNFHDYVPNLRWLRLSIGLGERIPKFSVENLVILELLSSVKDEWGALRQIKMASKLKVLKLSGYWLDEFPEFPHSGSLEILDMTNCFHFLYRMDLDIGNLGNLKVMRLEDCGVRKIIGIDGIMPFENLKVLLLVNCEIREITVGTVGMMPMEKLKLLHLLPSSLTTLLIRHCRQLEWLPNIENLENLTYLCIQNSPTVEEILGVGGLKSLETLHVSGLVAVCNLDGLDCLYSLKSLSLRVCHKLERLPSMASLSKLLHLHVSWCDSLEEVQGLGGLESLQTLTIQHAESLSRLSGFKTLLFLNKLETLTISDCFLLTSLEFHILDGGCRSQASVLDSLQVLEISRTGPLLQIFCRMIELLMFPSLTKLTLVGGEIGDADTELRLDGLEFMEELVELYLRNLASIRRLPSLSRLGNLKMLSVLDAPELREIEGLAGLKSLEKLDLSNCRALERLPADDLYGLEQLKHVDISGCTNLIDLSALIILEPKVTIWWPDTDPTDDDFDDDDDLIYEKSLPNVGTSGGSLF